MRLDHEFGQVTDSAWHWWFRHAPKEPDADHESGTRNATEPGTHINTPAAA